MATASNGADAEIDDGTAAMTTVTVEATLAGDGLPDSVRDLARQDLGETNDIRRKALKRLRELIAGQPYLPCGSDEAFLTVFLRARKYDTLSAFKKVKGVFKAQRDNPKMFEDLCMHNVPFDAVCRKHQIMTVSQGTDPQGRPAALLRIGKWNTDICSENDMFRLGILHVLHLLRKVESQTRGLVIIFDLMGLGPHHLIQITPSAIRKLITLAQDCCPLRIKGVYVVNHPAIFNILFAVAKRFLRPKLIKRIQFFGYDVTRLQGLVPNDLIPDEYGGTLESYNYDVMEKQLKREENWFHEFLLTSRGDDERRLKADRRGNHFGTL